MSGNGNNGTFHDDVTTTFGTVDGFCSELGDVNLTAIVDIFDLFALSDFQSEPNSIQINESCADINGDNEINIFDVVGFVNMILNDSE